jgi:carbamoyltransferase
MPFAPIVLSEHANEVFYCDKSLYTAEFMTMCYTTREEWIERIPAVIHEVDKTARPQVVVKENNPKFYEILNEYYKISGIPVLLNTSFNGHGEPIINTPDNAFVHLDIGTIDYLVINNYIFYKKEN